MNLQYIDLITGLPSSGHSAKRYKDNQTITPYDDPEDASTKYHLGEIVF